MTEETRRVRLKVGDAEIEVEGDEKFINEKLAYFEHEILEKLPARLEWEPGERIEKEGKELSLFQLHEQKQPKSHPEIATCFAFYHVILEGADEVSLEQVEKDYTNLGLTKPAKMAREMHRAMKDYRWLQKGSKPGRYKLTNLGENMVRKLPER